MWALVFPVLWFLSAAQWCRVGARLVSTVVGGLQFREGQRTLVYRFAGCQIFLAIPSPCTVARLALSLFTPKSAYILLCTFQAICLFGATVLLTRTLTRTVTGLVSRRAPLRLHLRSFWRKVVAHARFWLAPLLPCRGHTVCTAILLGLFALKPNWGSCRDARMMEHGSTNVVVVISCIATTLLMGLRYGRIFSSSLSNPSILTHYEAYKQIHQIRTRSAADALLFGYGVSAVVFRSRVLDMASSSRNQRLPHALGIAVLVAICVNPYASFYDAICCDSRVYGSMADTSTPRKYERSLDVDRRDVVVSTTRCTTSNSFSYSRSRHQDYFRLSGPPWRCGSY